MMARASIKALRSDIELQSVLRHRTFNFACANGEVHIAGLAFNPPNLAGADLRKLFQEARYQRLEIDQPIRSSPQYNNGEGKMVDALLEGQIAINRDECVELLSCLDKERTITHAGPPEANDGCDIVT